MVRGPQFENTFFEDNEYKAPITATCKHCNQVIKPHPETGRWMDTSGATTHNKERNLEEVRTSTDLHEPTHPVDRNPLLQGMLFSPHVATGTKSDPLISEEQRRQQVRTSYNIDNLIPAKGVGDRKLDAQRTMLEEAGYQSGIPHHILKEVNARAKIVPYGGRAEINSGKVMKLHEEASAPTYQTSEKTVPKFNLGAPIPNPHYNSLMESHNFDDDFFGRSDLAHHGTFFDHTGAEIDKSKIAHDESYDKSYIDPKDLPEGHSANIYPGKGKSTSKYVATPFQVESGWTQNGYRNSWFHTRHEAIPTGETETITERKRTPGTRSINRATLTHETGHALDPNVNARVRDDYNPDTVIEAVADGFTDRHSRYKGRLYTELAPSKTRAKDFKNTGYTVDHHSVGKNNLNKALYVAVRQHVSMGDHNHLTIPSRDSYRSTAPRTGDSHVLTHANTMLLGHMYTTHAHVRDILEHTGLAETGKRAAEYFRGYTTDAGRSAPGYEQGELF